MIYNDFPPSVGWVFTFLSFDAQKFLTLIKSNLSIFLLLPVLLVSYLTDHGPIQCHDMFPLFSSKHFIVLALMFRSLINFELIFATG